MTKNRIPIYTDQVEVFTVGNKSSDCKKISTRKAKVDDVGKNLTPEDLHLSREGNRCHPLMSEGQI